MSYQGRIAILKHTYPEQRKQYAAVIVFICLLFISGSILLIMKFADLGKNSYQTPSVQGISIQVQDLNPASDNNKNSSEK